MSRSETVYSWAANPQESAKVFGSCRLVPPRRFPRPSDLSDAQWSPPSGFDMVDLSRISEKRGGFHASRGGRVSQTAGVASSASSMQPSVHKGDRRKARTHTLARIRYTTMVAVRLRRRLRECSRGRCGIERANRRCTPSHFLPFPSHFSLGLSRLRVKSFFSLCSLSRLQQRALPDYNRTWHRSRPINLDPISSVRRTCGISAGHLLASALVCCAHIARDFVEISPLHKIENSLSRMMDVCRCKFDRAFQLISLDFLVHLE